MIDEIVTCTTERYRSCAKGKGEFCNDSGCHEDLQARQADELRNQVVLIGLA